MEGGGRKVRGRDGVLLLLLCCRRSEVSRHSPTYFPAQINENKALSKKKQWQPYSGKCTTCKSSVAQGYTYCQGCAYRKGICAM